MDERGTGWSDPIDCPEAQDYSGDWVEDATHLRSAARRVQRPVHHGERCRRHGRRARLPRRSARSTSTATATARSSRRRSPRGTPTCVRSAVFDGTYPIEGLDPWYATTADAAAREPAALLSPQPRHLPRRARRRWSGLLGRRRPLPCVTKPVTTTAPDAYGVRGPRHAHAPSPARHACSTATSPRATCARSPPRSWRSLNDNPLPLARMVAEVEGCQHRRRIPARWRSRVPTTSCAASPKAPTWPTRARTTRSCGTSHAGRAARERQFAARGRRPEPAVTTSRGPRSEWASSEFFVYDYCIGWPKPTVAEPPFPGGRYPDVPVLVLNGDLDLRTDVYQAREVAAELPATPPTSRSRNAGHVTAIFDPDRVRRRSSPAGSSARWTPETPRASNDIPEHRVVQRFAEKAADAPQADVAGKRRPVHRTRTAGPPTSRSRPSPTSSTAGTRSPATPEPASTAASSRCTRPAAYPFTTRVWSLS